jgi:uncharacterized protein (DUF362 family)
MLQNQSTLYAPLIQSEIGSVYVGRVQDGNIKSSLALAFKGIGGVKLRQNARVVIKPNLCTFMGPETGATTELALVEALIELLNELQPTCQIAVVESRSVSGNVSDKFNRLGYTELEKKYGNVRLVDLDKEPVYTIRDNKYPGGLKVPEIFLLSDYFVSVPKLKTSDQQKITCVLKNQFGCMPGRKEKYHPWLSQVIVDVNRIFVPDLCIVDGVVAMEGRGPTGGRPRRMDLIIVGRNAVATDSVAARIMGISPKSVPSMKRANETGLGPITGFELLGEDLRQMPEKFESIPSYVVATFALEDWLKRLGHTIHSLGILSHIVGGFLYAPS